MIKTTTILSAFLIYLTFSQPIVFNYNNKGDDWVDTCKTGQSQSPVNIVLSEVINKNIIDVDISLSNEEFQNIARSFPTNVNEAHNIQSDVNFSQIRVNQGDSENTWEAIQFHLHAPSENQIDGKNLDVEMHIVHQDAEGNLAVISLLFDKSIQVTDQSDLFFNDDHFDLNDLSQNLSTFNPAVAIDKKKFETTQDYYYYEGSLTTPPCTENVKWFVYSKPFPITDDQVKEITKYFSDDTSFAGGNGNNRAVQPLNERKIYKIGQTVSGNIQQFILNLCAVLFIIILI